MHYEIIKLDGRFAGFDKFKYRVQFVKPPYNSQSLTFWETEIYNNFCKVRNWCIETYGSACERDMLQYVSINETNQWAWHVNLNNKDLYIYLQSDKELALLQLKFQVDQK